MELTDEERDQLHRWARRRSSAQALALRSRIVLDCAEGLSNKEVAQRQRGARSARCASTSSQAACAALGFRHPEWHDWDGCWDFYSGLAMLIPRWRAASSMRWS